MPTTKRRTKGTKPRRGRPPSPDSYQWQPFTVCLRNDLAAYVRTQSKVEDRSYSDMINRLVAEAIAHRAQQAAGAAG